MHNVEVDPFEQQVNQRMKAMEQAIVRMHIGASNKDSGPTEAGAGANQDPIAQIMAVVQQTGSTALANQVQQQLALLQPAKQHQQQTQPQQQPINPVPQNQGWGGNQNWGNRL